MRTCLETLSVDGIGGVNGRHDMIARSDYQRGTNEYSATHKDALADGDSRGKGTGSAGHGDWLPSCTSAIGVFNYSNFDTAESFHAGNDADNLARTTAMTRSLYSPVYEYNAALVDTSLNVLEGQYVMP